MEFREYVEAFKQEAHKKLGFSIDKMRYYPKGYEASDSDELEWIRKANIKVAGISEDRPLTEVLVLDSGIDKDTGIATIQRVDLRYCYEKYGEDFDAALEEIKNQKHAVDSSLLMNHVFEKRNEGDYAKLKDSLILRPLNYGLYGPLLEGFVYRRIGDVALVLYMVVGDADHSLTTSKIQREELNRWGISDEEALDNALVNTARLYPPCVYDLRIGREVNLLTTDFSKEDVALIPGSIMISTFRTTNGAAALFYPGVVEKLMKVMGGAFEAVFMNINDVMIFACGDREAIDLAEIASYNGPCGEMLSGNRYLCSEDGIHMIESEL